MAKFSFITKTYILGSIVLGTVCFLWFLNTLHNDFASLITLFILFILGSFTQIIKVEGTTKRSHYATSFLVYAFTLFRLGLVEAILVIIVSYLVEWMWRRPPWYISSFNSASLILVSTVAFFIYNLVNPVGDLDGWRSVVAIVISMVVFTMLNHLMVGIIVWLARGENFVQSGIFDIFPLIIDLTLLVMGGSFFLIWNFNPYAVILFLTPTYLIYSTLRVPALERQTELDPKTGLYNNVYFINQLENELTRAQRFDRPLAVLMTDLDLLRNINNTYGHLAGDEVLQGIAKILQASVRQYDVVARFGGEEFSVLMPETTAVAAFECAEKIRRTIEAAEFTVATSVTPIKVTMSIGVSNRLKPNQTKEEIIHNADTVLYHAKLQGRNRTCIYTEGMTVRLFPVHKNTASTEQPESRKIAPQPIRLTTENLSNTDQQTNASAPVRPPAELSQIQQRIYLFLLLLTAIAGLLFMFLYQPFDLSNVFGLSLFALVLIFTESFSTEIYMRDTAVSTSAAPLVAGALLFGPLGALILSIVFSITTYLKFKGPKDRIIFNAVNQLIPAMLFLGLIHFLGLNFGELPPLVQILITVLCMVIVYAFTTSMVAIGVGLNSGKKISTIWWEQFSWLAPYYLVMGVMAYALIFGFVQAGLLGLGIIIFPLMMLRIGQIQYIGRTRTMVTELREKNSKLERSSDEISNINEGLLDTLADLIDLRDPSVLGHSQHVTQYAVLLAEKLGFEEPRIKMIRKASLLHDLGKLGVPETILAKPTSLSDNEYQMMKNHTTIGVNLLSRNPSLKVLIPIVRHHHEHFDGQGYPDGLKGNNIPFEARIVSVADAIDAMSSNRVYRRALDREDIITELKRNSGAQFDPQIAAVAIDLLESGTMKLERSNEAALKHTKSSSPTSD